jgi:hypothetical protein
MNGMILSHIPVHAESLGRFGVNIHGHLHANRVRKARGVDARTGEVLYGDEIDPRYHCVCVEQTDFAPILFEDVIKRIEAEGGEVGFRNGNGPTSSLFNIAKYKGEGWSDFWIPRAVGSIGLRWIL